MLDEHEVMKSCTPFYIFTSMARSVLCITLLALYGVSPIFTSKQTLNLIPRAVQPDRDRN